MACAIAPMLFERYEKKPDRRSGFFHAAAVAELQLPLRPAPARGRHTAGA